MAKPDPKKPSRYEDDDDDLEARQKARREKEKAAKAAPSDDDDDDVPKKKSRASDEDNESPKQKSRARDDDDDDNKGDDDEEVYNLAEADENSVGQFEVLPKGDYICQVSQTDFKEFSTGSKGMKVVLKVSEGPFAKSKDRKSAAQLFTNVVLTSETLNIVKANLKAMGAPKSIWNAEKFKASMLQELADSGELLGNDVVASVSIREYEGKKQNNVTRMRHPEDKGSGKAAAKGRDRFMGDD
jgi:hypothetical protein